MNRVKILFAFSVLALGQLTFTESANAGPLLDWLLGRNRCRTGRVFRPQVPAVANPNCSTCTTTCQQTCQRVVVNYVPYTAFRTSWERVPVTTYRQTSSTDPCTGCTVTCNRPCTTYTWRMKQQPYTTYRPVYRTETFQRPMTFTTQLPATGGCSTCAAPGLPQAAPVQSSQTFPTAPVTGGTPTPAAQQVPSLNPQNLQSPVISGSTTRDVFPSDASPAASGSTSRYQPLSNPNPTARWNNQTTQLANADARSARLSVPAALANQAPPSIQRWDYSPVRQASFEVEDGPRQGTAQPAREFVGQLQPAGTSREANRESSQDWVRDSGSQQHQTKQQRRLNEGWRRD